MALASSCHIRDLAVQKTAAEICRPSVDGRTVVPRFKSTVSRLSIVLKQHLAHLTIRKCTQARRGTPMHPSATRTAGLALIAAVSVGCKKPPEPPPRDPAMAPILPAPHGTRYALGEREPADPLVAQLVRQGMLPWVESLSGAATALALDDAQLYSLSAARWAAVRAGYPHPVRHIITGTEPPGALPTELIDALRPLMNIGDHVGLIRARTAQGDRWVALIARPQVDIDSFSREYALRDRLEVTSSGLASWSVVSPSGKTTSGRLPVQVQLDEPGEWLLEFTASSRDRSQLLSLPIYVATKTPMMPLFPPSTDIPMPGPDAIPEHVQDALAEVRAAFALPALQWDHTLATLAGTPVEQVMSGSWDAERGERRLRGAGFVGGPVAQLTCTAPNVPACIEQMLGRADDRAALLESGLRLVGAAGQTRVSGVTLVINLSSE